MTETLRRIVTAHSFEGKAIVRSIDQIAPKPIPSGDAEFATIWATSTVPVDLNSNSDGADLAVGKTLSGGSVIRVVDMLPGKCSPMHRSFSIDYGIVISGELELELEGGEKVHLTAGDVVVQRGTNHLWRNPNPDKVCRIIFILIEASPIVVNGQRLEEIHP